MKNTLGILFTSFLNLEGYCQTSDKQHIFSQSDTVYLDGRYDSMVRFTPSLDEVNIADSLAEIRVKNYMQDYGRPRDLITNPTIDSMWAT
jgi:hypothetical protein